MEKIKVGILGCTGAVGQKFISLLQGHPYFEISEIAASEQSAGKLYGQRVNWLESTPMPERIANMKIKTCNEDLDCRILFSALDARVAGDIETQMANKGYVVVSNSKNHRMDENVPLMIPEINEEHFNLIEDQKKTNNSGGYIITNPNCSTIVLAIALYPVYKNFGITKVVATAMQAISGAGYPGVASLDILGNIVPHIEGEEEKIESETLKILGKYDNGKIKYADFPISASCNRVPVKDGHMVSVSIELERKAGRDVIIESFRNAKGLGLPFSPEHLLYYDENPGRPQPALDVIKDRGMAITIGNLRECNGLDWKFTALGHNTIRGAAGAAILNAEYLHKNNLL